MIHHLQFEVFLKVYETGSFTKAAEKLNMTQSAVSHSIAALEKNLGIKLFERVNRTVKITQAGISILPHVREIFNQEEIIKQKARGLVDLEFGLIKIGCFPSFIANLLPGLIKKYNEMFPKIEFHVLEGDYNDIIEWVKEGSVDFGISINSSELTFEPLIHDSMLVVMSESHHLRDSPVVTIEDIATEPYINVKGYEKLLNEILRNTEIKLDVKYSFHNTYSIISAVEAGLGVSLLPELALPKHNAKICSKPLYPTFTRTIGTVIRSIETLTPASKSFLNFLSEQLIS
ncbi:LysR family transcriptional regulator [Paenibacillus sp. UNC451MF]|uniref:LysR family transcriptional regulator n=1 Tax=Paenibacillus sp. UNC451MF TaxID=1449063 RepID=UPI000562D32C|nr:LysR family transcriptional regulator [Paenibacillus sp. UNC451MF]